MSASQEIPTIDELNYYYTSQQNLSIALEREEDPQEFLFRLVHGARLELAAGEHVESNKRFLSVAEPLIVKP